MNKLKRGFCGFLNKETPLPFCRAYTSTSGVNYFYMSVADCAKIQKEADSEYSSWLSDVREIGSCARKFVSDIEKEVKKQVAIRASRYLPKGNILIYQKFLEDYIQILESEFDALLRKEEK